MARIKITRITLVKIIIAVILMLLTIYANFITIRRIAGYAIEVNFYDKLAVAYDLGGVAGLKRELAKIRTQEKLRHELAVAEQFDKQLDTLKDPEGFIDQALSEKKNKIKLLGNFRNIAMALILAVFILRIFVNRKNK